MCLFTRSLLFTGHVSRFDTLHMSFSLSLCSLMQSYSRRFTVCSPPLHGHSGGSIILKRCRLALVLPWAVNIAVKFGVNLILLASLSLMIWKNHFFACHFVLESHWFSHLAMLWALSCCTISFFGILLNDMSSILAASLASLSASSFPWIPTRTFIQVNVIVQLRLSSTIADFPISSMR